MGGKTIRREKGQPGYGLGYGAEGIGHKPGGVDRGSRPGESTGGVDNH
jgi:hypothetical protein